MLLCSLSAPACQLHSTHLTLQLLLPLVLLLLLLFPAKCCIGSPVYSTLQNGWSDSRTTYGLPLMYSTGSSRMLCHSTPRWPVASTAVPEMSLESWQAWRGEGICIGLEQNRRLQSNESAGNTSVYITLCSLLLS
jgi:hypothetical protein